MDNDSNMRTIPEQWIQQYVDQLLDLAKRLDEGSKMRAAVLLRAEHAMDLVQTYRDHELRTEGPRS